MFKSTTGRRHKVALASIVVAASAGLALSGCTHAPTTSGSATNSAGAKTSIAAIAGRPVPVANPKNKTVKVAMIGFSNNPYWVSRFSVGDHHSWKTVRPPHLPAGPRFPGPAGGRRGRSERPAEMGLEGDSAPRWVYRNLGRTILVLGGRL